MKEQILKFRDEGKTYNEIVNILGCAKSTVSYYCGKEQKKKSLYRQNKRRKNFLIKKTENFKHTPKGIKNRKEQVRKFNKRSNNSIDKELDVKFTWEDIIKKFGENTSCYLSGEELNLYENNYSFDHIIPVSKGGTNELDNLGITHKIVNTMKNNLSVEEFINWCKTILEHNGYKVTK